MATEHQLKTLSTALDAYLAAECAVNAALTHDNAVAHIMATNVLFDACVMCGMPINYPNESKWASARVAQWLVEA